MGIISYHLPPTNVVVAEKRYTKNAAELLRIEQNPNRNNDLLDSEILGVIAQCKHAATQYFRIIDEIIEDDVYVHIICHQRKDFVSLLQERVLR